MKKQKVLFYFTILAVSSLIGFGILYATDKLGPLRSIYHALTLSSGWRGPANTLNPTEKITFRYEGLFKDLEGNVVQLEDYKGKVIFINFWASWCRPCRSEMPYISELHKKLKETEGLEFLLINFDSDLDKAKNYLNEKGYKLPVIYSPNELVGSLKPNSLPTTMVVNPDGEIIFYQEGMSNFDTQEFRDLLIHNIKN